MAGIEEHENGTFVEPEPAQKGRRGCLRWLMSLLLFLLLLALWWPVSKEKKEEPKAVKPPRFTVLGSRLGLAKEAELSELDLKTNYRTNYVVLAFQLKNDEGDIANMTWDNFELIVKQGKLTKEIRAHRASADLYPLGESPWGRSFAGGDAVELKLLFLMAKEAKIEAFRVYDADRRTNRYKEFPLDTSEFKPGG